MNIAGIRVFAYGMLAALATAICAGPAVAAGPWEVSFRKIVVDEAFRSEGVAVADVNHDGKMDIMVGDLWYEAPDWKVHEIRNVGKYVANTGYSKCFACFAQDVNGDGWADQVVVGMPGLPGLWYENPQNKPGQWKQRPFAPNICNETPLFADLLGDGHNVYVFGSNGAMAWFAPGKDVEKPFDMHVIAAGPNAPGTDRYSHGLGVGDVNCDGRNDVVIATGWWEAPADRTVENWTFHKADLGPDCANMLVYDVDGDGDSDIISSSAHAYGIWWHEQKSSPGGCVFEKHEIARDWSQSHAAILADMNGDGIMDLVTGKRHLAHNGGDPGEKDPAVMYWYELRRPEKGKVEFIPHKFDDSSGVGTQFLVCDFNGDGRLDVVTSNKSGVRVFLQNGGAANPATGPAKAAAPAPAGSPKWIYSGGKWVKAQAETAAASEPVALFDGKTFAGWEGNMKSFRIEDGAIVGGSMTEKVPRNEFLCTTKTYGDFELRATARLLGGGANAGIQVRTKRIPDNYEVSGYQADMGQGYWGALYDESRRGKVLARPDEATLAKALKPADWNSYVIRCQGPRIQLWLNGARMVDYTETDDKIDRGGIIGLQIHGGGPSEAWYKDITITELK